MGSTTRLTDVASGAMQSRKRLLAPLRYLSIEHEEKGKYDLWIPLLLATALWLGAQLLPSKIAIFGNEGILKYFRDVLIMSVPFMIGALAAVAMGSPGPRLDRRPAGDDLLLDGKALTLRQFTCYLLGYLSFISIATLCTTIAGELLREPIKLIAEHYGVSEILKDIFLAILLVFFSITLITILWALYFLTVIVNRD